MKDNFKTILQFTICLLLIFVAYIPTFVWMWQRWNASESYYGHGVLIPLVSLYVIWQRRQMLKSLQASTKFAGLFFIACGLLVHILCALLKVYFISGFSFVLVVYGLALFFFGPGISQALIFPIFFLLAMIPLPLVLIGNLTVKLKLFAAQGATFLLNRVGFLSILDGNVIRMRSSFIEVGAPCSGLRSLISLLTLGVLFAFSLRLSYIRKGLLLLSAVPIAIAANVLRIVLLAIANDLYGKGVALGPLHSFSGFLVFAFAFLSLLFVGRMLELGRDEKK